MEKEKKTRKKLLVLLGVSLFTLLGSTLAYFTASGSVANGFKTGVYQNQIVETFESPTNWIPGTTTEKTIKVTNTGNVDMALRASITEEWVNAKGVKIGLKDADNNVAAIINFNSGWTKDADGYYYYGAKDSLTKLTPSSTSSSFINSVKFNENIKSDLIENVSADGRTITYTSSGDGYDNATYTLSVKIDTIQYDQASNLWS